MRIRILIFILTYIFCINLYAENSVAVIDSGYSVSQDIFLGTKLCDTGHYDFIKNKKQIGNDSVGHGSTVAGLVGRSAQRKNYCIVVMKVLDNKRSNNAADNVCHAIRKATEAKVKAINISLTGPDFSFCEYNAIANATRKGIKIFVAAGNSSKNLNDMCEVYPACYNIPGDNFYIVGALDARFQPTYYSNRGVRVNIWKQGDAFGPFNTGTSFASPRAAGEYIYSLTENAKKKSSGDKTSGQSFRKTHN